MDSREDEGNFFSKLKTLAAHLDKQVPALQEQVNNPPRNTGLCQLRAERIISQLRSDVKSLKTSQETDCRKVKEGVKFLAELLACSDSLLVKTEKSLSNTEDYLQQYGYKPPEPEVETEEIKEEPTEGSTKKEDLKSSVTGVTAGSMPPPVQDGSRTPKLEDRGISKYTMEFLRSASKKPQAQNEPVPAFHVKQPTHSIPEKFQHDGIMVTPSLLGFRPSSDESIVGFELHAALASPVPPIFETPGIKQIQKHPDMFPDPTTRLPFDRNPCDSPAVPIFQSTGLTKQIAKIAPCQAPTEKKKAVMGLFQEGGSFRRHGPQVAGIKQEPQELQSQMMNKTYSVDQEPQPPDLTYSLEAMSDMTGVYSIVPKMPAAPESLAERLLQEKENKTPPAPELLSDRLNKIAIAKGDNLGLPPQKRTQNGGPPPPPKLFGNYSWMQKENL